MYGYRVMVVPFLAPTSASRYREHELVILSVDGETRDGEGACELQRMKLTHVFRTDLLCATQVCMHLNLLSMVRISCGYVSRALFFVYIYVWAGEGTPARRTQA